MDWLDEGGMATEEQVAAAEARLGVSFPAAYRAMLLERGGTASAQLDEMIGPEELRRATDLDVTEFECVADWSEARLALVVPIFRDCAGNYYALDFSAEHVPRVLDLEHDGDEVHDYGTFDDFIAAFDGGDPAGGEES